MPAIKEVVIRGRGPEMAAFLERLEASLTGGWSRDREFEQRERDSGGGKGLLCFSCSEAPGRPAAVLRLCPGGAVEWRVSSVTPRNTWKLNDEERDTILAEFAAFLDRLGHGAATEMEGPEAEELRYDFSRYGRDLLRAYLAVADPMQPSLADRERWSDFLIHTHQEERFLDTSILKEWLASEGWPAEVQDKIANEYVAELWLLSRYDKERCPSCR